MKTTFLYWTAVVITALLVVPQTALAQETPVSASSSAAPTSTMHTTHDMHDMSDKQAIDHSAHKSPPANEGAKQADADAHKHMGIQRDMRGMNGKQSVDHAAHKSRPANEGAKPPNADAHMHMSTTHEAKGEPSSVQGKGMDHGDMSDMGMGSMDGMDHGDMSTMDMGSMQGGSAPPDARDPDYSDGIRFSPGMDAHMMGEKRFATLRFNRLEYFDGQHGHGSAFDADGWYGGDLNKFWWKLEGEHSQGTLEDYRAEALWSHAVSAYWDTQLGVRHDGGEGPGRDWAAFGVQGLAPYWFELSATAYVGQGGRTAARLEAEYEILFTQRLILQPKVEVNAYGKDDPARGIGSGLSDASFGLRLRYEVRRRFAPYIGVEWQRRLGATADYARQANKSASDRQFVVGIRIWL